MLIMYGGQCCAGRSSTQFQQISVLCEAVPIASCNDFQPLDCEKPVGVDVSHQKYNSEFVTMPNVLEFMVTTGGAYEPNFMGRG